MLILAIDTAQKNGSVALATGDASEFRLIETLAVDGGTFSAQLVPRIALVLSKNGFDKHDISAFAACVGPGSFTGLRIGLAAIKGLAEVLAKPIVAVSSLEALAAAAPAGSPPRTLAVLDAGRSEFYVGEYMCTESDTWLRQKELLCTGEELEQLLNETSQSCVVTSDVKTADSVRKMRSDVFVAGDTGSGQVARLGWRKLLAGDTVSADDLDANYLRRDETLFGK